MARTALLDEVEQMFKSENIRNYLPDLAKKYVNGEIDVNGFAHVFTQNLAVNAVGSRGNSYDPRLKEHFGILRDSHSAVELLETLRLWVLVPAGQTILRYQHAHEEEGTGEVGIRTDGIEAYTQRTQTFCEALEDFSSKGEPTGDDDAPASDGDPASEVKQAQRTAIQTAAKANGQKFPRFVNPEWRLTVNFSLNAH